MGIEIKCSELLEQRCASAGVVDSARKNDLRRSININVAVVKIPHTPRHGSH